MDAELFTVAQKKHFVRTISDAWSFVPPPLPPPFDPGEIYRNVSRAERAIGQLNGAARRLPDAHMLITPLVRKEALTTSAMEGTITTIDEMLLQEVSPNFVHSDDAREAINYRTALTSSLQMMESLPLSGRLLKRAHEVLLSGLSPARGASKRPGEYKTMQNAIGSQRDTLQTARYVPPPPAETPACMQALEAYINRPDVRPGDELIDLALVHYQFEAIHPFQDGNGRIGRMLICLMAINHGVTQLPLLHLSACLEHKKQAYVDALYNVSAKGAWNDWINFFMTAVAESCDDATDLADKVLALQAELRKRARTENNNHRLATIVDALFERQWTTAQDLARLCNVSFPTARSDIEQLVRLKILTHVVGTTRPEVFVCQPVLDLSRRSLALTQ